MRRRDFPIGLLLKGIAHPFVIGELALGNPPWRDLVLGALHDLPKASVATDREVLQLVDQHLLFGPGIHYIDAHLLAAVLLTAGAGLWRRDRRLERPADRSGLATASLG